MMKIPMFVVMLALVAATVFGISMSAEPQTVVVTEVQFVPGPAIRNKAESPKPASTARQQTKKGTIGEEEMLLTTDSNNDYWVEDIDVKGNGQTTETDMMWDNTKKVLYAYADETMMCKNGGTADGDILIATYGKGNTANKPAGSGWWMASLDAGECAMRSETLYGCRFDKNGKNTACGIAQLDDKTDELTIIKMTTSK